MGRHAARRSPGADLPAGSRRTGPRRWPRRLLLLTAGLSVLAATAATIAPRQALARLPWAQDATCTGTAVDLLAAPDISPTIERVVAPLQGTELDDGRCLAVAVRSQDPATTIRGSAVLPADRAPQVWVPDSSLWATQLKAWQYRPAGSLASSPVVLATARSTLQRTGWDDAPPTWAEAMRGKPAALSIPDLADRADGLGALMALWQSLGKGVVADKAVAGAVLAADRVRLAVSSTPSPTAAGAVLQPRTEQAVFAAVRDSSAPIVALYPRGASPAMDYPVMQLADPASDPVRGPAVRAVLARLRSPAAQAIVRADGFRDRVGAVATPPAGSRIRAGALPRGPLPNNADVTSLLGRLSRLAQPSRMLALIDVSLSMGAQLPSGLSRIQLAAAAADAGAGLLPDASSVGLWSFAVRLDGTRDHRQILALKPLGSSSGRGDQRAALLAAQAQLPSQLQPGGTALYDTVLAATREVRRSYDPRAVNSVILFTDGRNEDPDGISQRTLLSTLRSEANRQRPVPVFALGIGPAADMRALSAITQPTGGRAYRVNTAAQVQAALYDGLNRRQPTGG